MLFWDLTYLPKMWNIKFMYWFVKTIRLLGEGYVAFSVTVQKVRILIGNRSGTFCVAGALETFGIAVLSLNPMKTPFNSKKNRKLLKKMLRG